MTLSYEQVKFFDSRKEILRSRLDIHSLELGTLTPKQYRVVAGRSKQGGELLSRQIQKVFDEFDAVSRLHGELDCITIPILSRTLLEGAAARMIFDEFERNAAVSPSNICFEISSDVLFEDIERVKERFRELRGLSIKIAISELGDEFCPIFRLSVLPYDYGFADGYSLKMLDGGEETARSLPECVHAMGARVFAPGISENAVTAAKNAGYDGYSLDTAPAALGEEVNRDEEQRQ